MVRDSLAERDAGKRGGRVALLRRRRPLRAGRRSPAEERSSILFGTGLSAAREDPHRLAAGIDGSALRIPATRPEGTDIFAARTRRVDSRWRRHHVELGDPPPEVVARGDGRI